MNERRESDETLPARDSYAEAKAVGEERAVGVAPFREVDNTEQLREQDNVDQVGAESPAEDHCHGYY